MVGGEYAEDVSPTVAQTGEGQWTVETGKKLDVKTPSLEAAVKFRGMSFLTPSYAGKILSALREQFGGHNSLIHS